MNNPEKVDLKSLDISEDKKKQLKQLFPEVFTEKKIDFDKLKQVLGESVETGKERYGMNWAGKADCIKIIQKPSIGTLKPCKEESVNFDTTENLFIEGDNLEVLKLLQKSYYGKIKMIYIDPPYNTGNDFIYPDDFSESLETYLKYTGQVDAEGKKFSTNTEESGRFHTKWINMMYPRLYLARNLLKEDGVIFISIDDNEATNLRKICDEIFGQENFLSQIVLKNKAGAGAKPKGFINVHEYILCYVKSESEVEFIDVPYSEENIKLFNKKDDKYSIKGPYGTWALATTSMDDRPNLRFPIIYNGEEIWPEKQWLWSKERVEEALKNNELVFNKKSDGGWSVRFKQYLKDENGILRKGTPLTFLDGPYTHEGTKDMENLGLKRVFPFPKPARLIMKLLMHKINGLDDKEEVFLDFFAGSCSTAHAVLDLNREDGGTRKFICVQLPELTEEGSEAFKAGYKTIADIGKERIRRVIKKIEQETRLQEFDKKKLDLGFKVFKLDKSNFKVWESQAGSDKAALEKQLELHIDHIDPKASQEDIFFELLLKTGFELSTKIEKIALVGKTVFSIAEGAMFICLEKELTKELVKEMAEKAPSRVVCLDSSFSGNDQLKTNAVQTMKSKQIEFRTV